MNPDWPRWIAASINQNFDNKKQNLFLYIEGQDRPKKEPGQMLELRVDGPYISQPTINWCIIDLEINVVVKTMKDEKDLYNIERNIGIAMAAFSDPINVLKYGTGPNDDNTTSVMCLQLKTKDREKLIVSRFGIIDPTNRLMQATVEGHYEAQFSL